MSSEPRSKNYPHVYQRSLDAVKDTPGEPALWQVMRALALDPLEAQDAKDEQQWPSSDFATFCAHPDKNARQAALETIATWIRLQPPKQFSNAVSILGVYNRWISLWSLIPLTWYGSAYMTTPAFNDIAEEVDLAIRILASDGKDHDANLLFRRKGSYFEREWSEINAISDRLMVQKRYFDAMRTFALLVDHPEAAGKFVDQAALVIQPREPFRNNPAQAREAKKMIKSEIINRILTYPYNW